MAERLRSVPHLVNLVDACSRCSAVFRIANEHLCDDRFEGFSEKLWEVLDLFIFQLQKESQRNGEAEPEEPRTYQLNCTNPALLRGYANNELRSAVEGYDELLVNRVPGHARAMVRRQREALMTLLRDLETLPKAS